MATAYCLASAVNVRTRECLTIKPTSGRRRTSRSATHRHAQRPHVSRIQSSSLLARVQYCIPTDVSEEIALSFFRVVLKQLG